MLIGKDQEAFDSDDYIFELKLDGIRGLTYSSVILPRCLKPNEIDIGFQQRVKSGYIGWNLVAAILVQHLNSNDFLTGEIPA